MPDTEPYVFTAIAAGDEHCLALTDDGRVIAWGYDQGGMCNVPEPNADFTDIAAGDLHSLGLKADSSIVGWGHNQMGQCTPPAPNTNFIALAGGDSYSMGLRSDGSIACWGSGSYGQCSVPVPNTDFVAIAAGGWHALGLKAYGSIVCWGSNYYDQCDVPAPNVNFVGIAGGGWHSLGLKSEETEIGSGGQRVHGILQIMGVSPCPFASTTSILLQSDGLSGAVLDVFDISGRLVDRRGLGALPAGLHSITWDGTGNTGVSLPGGVYILCVSAGPESASAKVLLVR